LFATAPPGVRDAGQSIPIHSTSATLLLRESLPAPRSFKTVFVERLHNNGHLWGHVQAIKQPTLLEITGPLMMSFAVASNLQYRLKEIDGGTLITLRHTALGLFPDGYREALSQGWPNLFDRIRRRVEKA
jgi:hypothetical protein